MLKNELLFYTNYGYRRINAYINRIATQILPSSYIVALELLGDIKGKKAEDKTKPEDKDIFKRLEDILKIDEGKG